MKFIVVSAALIAIVINSKEAEACSPLPAPCTGDGNLKITGVAPADLGYFDVSIASDHHDVLLESDYVDSVTGITEESTGNSVAFTAEYIGGTIVRIRPCQALNENSGYTIELLDHCQYPQSGWTPVPIPFPENTTPASYQRAIATTTNATLPATLGTLTPIDATLYSPTVAQNCSLDSCGGEDCDFSNTVRLELTLDSQFSAWSDINDLAVYANGSRLDRNHVRILPGATANDPVTIEHLSLATCASESVENTIYQVKVDSQQQCLEIASNTVSSSYDCSSANFGGCTICPPNDPACVPVCFENPSVVVDPAPGFVLDPTTAIAAINHCPFAPMSCLLTDDDTDLVIAPLDADADNDGIPNSLENISGIDPYGDDDGDGIWNYLDPELAACIDTDGDGICEDLNPLFDVDGDGVPNHLDLDSDGDRLNDASEANHGYDVDGDGVVDNTSNVGANGLLDDAEAPAESGTINYTLPDTLADGTPNFLTPDGDGDTIADGEEAQDVPDPDGDGEANLADLDSDNDGIPDAVEAGDADLTTPAVDTDGDGVPNYLDTDSDDDGIPDSEEQGDGNGDGIIDAYQAGIGGGSGTAVAGGGCSSNRSTFACGLLLFAILATRRKKLLS